jgi:AcrR family transcriptional regulator
MSPRKKEQNDELRDRRRTQILDATLSSYIEYGFNGVDMDEVAAKAGLAKGLVYYYFKGKRELFRETFEWAFGSLMEEEEKLLAAVAGAAPVERLVRYCWGMLALVKRDPRSLRFSMRLPFDARAVFGPEEWREGLTRSRLHQASIASMIGDIARTGLIPAVDAQRAAASFWAVFMANCLDIPSMVGGGKASPSAGSAAALERELLGFCFRMLGLGEADWLSRIDRSEEG